MKHDGFRLMVRKAGDRVRIYTRRGADWTDRYPAIVAAARRTRANSFLIDGEGVICGPDGLVDFDRLQSRTADHQAILQAFDLLELDGGSGSLLRCHFERFRRKIVGRCRVWPTS